MRKKIVAGNWKMHFTEADVDAFAKKFQERIQPSQNIVIFPQSLLISKALKSFDRSKVSVGAQNCYWELKGAFTGETSPETLKNMGVTYCLVGHSERRQLFHERIEDTALKVKALHALGVTPMICVGETLTERENGQTEKVILDQLNGALSQTDMQAPFVVAYEPVWAIGTGKVATPQIAQEAHSILRQFLRSRSLEQTPILYGGSVKPDNAEGLSDCPDIDGFLVGGASLDPENLAQICDKTFRASH